MVDRTRRAPLTKQADVSGKAITLRTAEAQAEISLSPGTIDAILNDALPKGDVIATAKVAAVMAVKKTPELIPLCHPVRVDHVEVQILPIELGFAITVNVSGMDRTGFEMEALTGAAVATLTIYDMVKSLEPGAVVSGLRVVSKSGGVSGDYRAG